MSTVQKVHIDFELDQYILDLHHEVNSLTYSEEGGATKEDKFTEFVMETLSDAGETEGTRLCHYEKENRWENIESKINGYALQEGYETLDIFISYYRDSSELYKVNKPDFDKLLKWPTTFINSSFKGYLDDIEESSEAHGLAKIVRKNFKEFVRVNIFILSNGIIPHDPPKNFKLESLDDLTILYHVWDVERLHRLAQSKSNREPIEIDFEQTLGEVVPCLSMPSESDLYECYLAIIPGRMLSILYRNYGARLLESNVRAFLQANGATNKGIRDTIRTKPHMFLPYNNGLATTAQEVKTRIENGKLLITGVKDFQIVNGGQTTASLFHTEKKYKDADLSKVFVQMKLTVIKDEDKKNEIVPDISRFANTQNKVSDLDLSSNNPLLQRLEELSRTTYGKDKEDSNKHTLWFFERVKGQYRETLNKEPTKGKQDAFKLKFPRNQFIIKSEVAKYMNVWKQLPYQVAKGSQKNYNIYLPEVEKEFKKDKLGRTYWQDIVANAILFRTADKLFGRKNQNPIGDTNIKSITVIYSLSLIHYLTNNKINLGEIWEEQEVSIEFQTLLTITLKYTYNFLINLDVALISEAAKSEKTWKSLKERTDYPIQFADFESWIISEEDFKKRYESKNDDVEEAKKYKNSQKIFSHGIKFWDGLEKYTETTKILSQYQENFANKIKKKLINSGTLTDVEIRKGVEIIDMINELEIDFDSIINLSKYKEIELVDPSLLYNRFQNINDEDWKRIIDLGEQTGTLSFNEICVIKSAIKKLKAKENLDIKRMKTVEDALQKVSKFGIKI